MSSTEAIRNPPIKYTQLFIDNKWVDSSDGSTCDVINPATEEVICKVQVGNSADVDAAVAAARRAFEPDAPWRVMDASQRAKLIEKVCCLIERDRAYLASLETIDNGKPFTDSYDEMGYTVDCLRYYGGWCDKIHGNTVAFTGSTAVGRDVMKNAALSNLKRCTFELGGKSPVVVCEDCHDIDEAVEISHAALFNNHGQNCCAGSRTYVHESIYDEFVKKAAALASQRVLGDPFKKGTQQGPQVSQNQMNKILQYVASGVKEGAKVQCGGSRWGEKGFYVEPTVFSDVTDDMIIAKEEIFGPVQSILKYSSFDEVIKRANDTNYGLASGIITKDITKALYFAKRIEAGNVWVNCYDVALAQTPFGGYKQSGQGRELGEAGLDEYLEDKTITIKVPAKL
ncbi:Aldehyde dehydrogenase domain [Trinorchestia longiramus]|nr:Aldehyde dehydrogenase domain [Trinorchestia longiramus]